MDRLGSNEKITPAPASSTLFILKLPSKGKAKGLDGAGRPPPPPQRCIYAVSTKQYMPTIRL